MNHSFFQPASWIEDGDAVQFEKHQCGGKRRSFITIEKRVILAQMVCVCSGHFITIDVQPLAGKGGLWLGQGGLQQREIPKPGLTAVAMNLIRMDLDRFGKGQKEDSGHTKLLCQRLERFAVSPIHRFECGAESLFAPRALDRRYD